MVNQQGSPFHSPALQTLRTHPKAKPPSEIFLLSVPSVSPQNSLFLYISLYSIKHRLLLGLNDCEQAQLIHLAFVKIRRIANTSLYLR